MPDFTILYDEPQEAAWFRALHPDFQTAKERSITSARGLPLVRDVLKYDRSDIILLDGDKPILAIEETVEVPSGHNVGQRFARMAAAAEAGIPFLYFSPYAAKKHGGETAGPRYMNARLFHSIDVMTRITNSAITTVNWPVDANYEVRRDLTKDEDVREYIETFLNAYKTTDGLEATNKSLLASEFHRRMVKERDRFVASEISNPKQYDGPPPSVKFVNSASFEKTHGLASGKLPTECKQVVVYLIDMRNIRSDPYTGMAMLYRYLYIAEHSARALVLSFPRITVAKWRAAASGDRKDVRLFRIAADGILFEDGFLPKAEL